MNGTTSPAEARGSSMIVPVKTILQTTSNL
jgi:hypothetical protein